MKTVAIPNDFVCGGTAAEVEFAAKRLREMSVKQHLVLDGALQINPANSMKDFINRTFQLEDYRIYYGATDIEELGKFASHYLGGGDFDSTYSDDGERILSIVPNGAFTENGYVYKCSGDAPKPYDGTNLDELRDEDYSVILRIAAPDGTEFVSLRLPGLSVEYGMPDEIIIARDTLGVEDLAECRLVDVQCVLPSVGNLADEYDGRLGELIQDANRFGTLLWRGNSSFLARVDAIMELMDYGTLAEALRTAEYVNQVDLRQQSEPSMELM